MPTFCSTPTQQLILMRDKSPTPTPSEQYIEWDITFNLSS